MAPFATIRFTANKAGQIAISVTPDTITERGTVDEDVKSTYTVSSANLQILGGKTIRLDLPGSPLTVGTAADIPVTITGANNMKTAKITVTIGANTADSVIELVRGDVATTTFDVINPSGSNNYVGTVSWTSSTSVTDGTLFSLKVTPKKTGEIPASLTI